MPRVMLTVSEEERTALVELARVEKRDPRAQGTMLLRRALENAGFLAPVNGNQSPRIEVRNGAQ